MGYIGKVDVGGTQHLVASTLYGTCDTPAATAEKIVTLADFDQLINGTTIHIKFENTNTVANPTLNVNETGKLPIYRYGTTAPSTSAASSWNAGAVVSFTYDSSNSGCWRMNDWINSDSSTSQNLRSTNTNYPVIFSSKAIGSTSTSSGVVYRNDSFYYNPSTQLLTIPNLNVTKINGITIGNTPAFTDTWRNIKVNGTEKLGTGTGTGALNFKNGTNTTVTYDSGIQINATDSKVTQTLNNTQDYYYPLLFSKKTIDDNTETTDIVYRSNNIYINPNGYLYAKNLQIGGGSDSGTLTLYRYSGGGFVLGELTQPFSISGGTITHSLPLISGNLFGSGNLIAGAGITLEDSAGLYTISTKNDIVLREVNLDNSNIDKVDNYIAIDEFVSSPDKKYYIEIYYTDNNGKNPGIAKIPLTTGMVPQGLGTVGNEFTLSITGDINTTYIRTSCFKFKTPSNSSQQIRLYGQSSYIVTFDNPSGTSSETKNSYTIQRKIVSNGDYTGFWVVPYKMRFIQEK